MNTDQLNKTLTLVANVGVIVGIVFLVLEIRQSNQIALATNELAIRESYGSSNELVAGNPVFAQILYNARDPGAELTGAEKEMAEYFVGRLFNTWVGSERAYDLELASRATLDLALDDLRWTFETYPAIRYLFREAHETYPSSHDTEVYQLIAELLESE